MTARPQNKIIIALDVDSIEKARELVALLKHDVGIFKVGKQLFTRYGPQVLTMIHEQGGNVFLDLKFHDIPNTVAHASEEVVRHGVFMFNVHALGGFEMMKQAVEAVHKKAQAADMRRPMVLAVTVLTSLSGEDLSAIGVNASVDEQVLRLARLSRSAGVDGVVASPREIEIIKKACGADFLVVTPGVRPKTSQSDDQKRIMTPGEALQKGADYIVIGRPVIKAPDPLLAVREIVKEVEHREQSTEHREQRTD